MRIRHQLRHVVLLKELRLPLSLRKHISLGDSAHLHDQTYLVCFIFSWEDRVAHSELGHDTPETPHVDAGCVGDTQNDLGGAVEARLDVGIDALVLETRGTEVDDFDT